MAEYQQKADLNRKFRKSKEAMLKVSVAEESDMVGGSIGIWLQVVMDKEGWPTRIWRRRLDITVSALVRLIVNILSPHYSCGSRCHRRMWYS